MKIDVQRRCALVPVTGGGAGCLVAVSGSGPERRLLRLFADPAPQPAAEVPVHPNWMVPCGSVELDGERFALSPFVEGVTLSELLQLSAAAGRPLSPAIAARIWLDLLAGLAAHQAVFGPHGLLSPRAVHIGVDGVTRLLSPSLVPKSRRSGPRRRRPELSYTSPEGLAGARPTLASDVFAAGVLAWEAFGGRRLFHGETDQDVTRKIVVDPIPRVASVAPRASVVDEVVRNALARSPSGRCDGAASLLVATERALGGVLSPASSSDVVHLLGSLAGRALIERSRALSWLFEDLRRGEEPKVALHVENARSAPADAAPAVRRLQPPPEPIGWRRTADGYAPFAATDAPPPSAPRAPRGTLLPALVGIVVIAAGAVVGAVALRLSGIERPASAVATFLEGRAGEAASVVEPIAPSPTAPDFSDVAGAAGREGTRVSLSDLPPSDQPDAPRPSRARPVVAPAVEAASEASPRPAPAPAFAPIKIPVAESGDVPPNPYET